MEKGDFRRERLADLGLERLQRPSQRGWSSRTRQARDRWNRFAAAGWDRTFFAVACVVAVIVAVIGVVALATRGGGSDPATGPASIRSEPTESQQAANKASPTPITIGVPVFPTFPPTIEPTAEPDSGDNRQDCDAIRGTAYESNAERDWYAANCGPAGRKTATPPPGQVIVPPPIQPTSPPVQPTSPPQGMTAGQAISLGIGWMTTSAPKAYDVDSGSCTAANFGDHWVVSCTGHLSGCPNTSCATQLDVCVYADRRVVPADSC
jgi:hypothetical protein